MNRPMLLTAAILTAFALVLTGGVVATLAAPQSNAADPGTAPLDQREAEWRQLLAQANERLEQAYATPNPPSPAQPQDIGVLRAAQAALLAVPGARLLNPPELVNYEGTPAYEVLLDQGTVYVDAATGQVLYNGPAATAQMTRAEDDHDDDDGGDEHDGHEDEGDHDEHEGEDDDD